MEIYCGQQPEGPLRQSNSSSGVVMRLSEPIFQSGRNITADNWFTNVELVRKLEEKKLSYVGTVRKNKRKLPANFVLPKGRQVFDSIFGYTKNETLVSYVPKKGKTVVLISSLHVASNEVKEDASKKPEIITFYNNTKSGVDVVDKLCASYNVARSTKRWPMDKELQNIPTVTDVSDIEGIEDVDSPIFLKCQRQQKNKLLNLKQLECNLRAPKCLKTGL
ncbi:uncharacterized protein LOC130897576 [Diorhabda carinulata]|uniref:uncharacterized protein LOC130897576 n=1 Tax=Diorhabda carinulata TaxID=1163345 RepID=UPI0025A0BD46|nr:uncharacterized protein LOC130897576 [Diorhabda carinulata]